MHPRHMAPQRSWVCDMVTLFQRKRSALAATPLALLLLLAAAKHSVFVSWGSELVTHIGDYTLQNWQVEQGLPQVSVTAIAQTPDGYLWVGTFNGLARFDGVRFTIFDEENTPALGNSAIAQLQVDEHGALWIVTVAGGLVRMAGGQFTQVMKENARILISGPKSSAEARQPLLLLDRDGQWRRIENNQILPLHPGFGTNDALSFLFENACLGWAVHQGKIRRLPELVSSASAGEAGASNRIPMTIHSAGTSQAGGYWVAGPNGLFRLQQGLMSNRVALLPALAATHFVIQEDGQGTFWAGQWGQGLFRLNADGSWQQFSAGTGLVDSHVNCLFRDREGSLWVGTGQAGLYLIRPRAFQVYDTESGANVVMCLTQDRQGRMWFGINGGGLHTWADGKLKRVTEPASLRDYMLTYSVLADRQDALWVGLYGFKALRWHAGAVTPYDLNDGSSQAMTPHAFLEDHAGTIWVGCTHGLLQYQGSRWVRHTTRDGLSSDTVVALAEDRAGMLYIGTDGGGLNCLHQGRFTHFTEQDGLADNHVASLYVDSEDTLWIGTVNGGLSRLKNGRFGTVSVKDGLPSKSIGSLLEDDLGNLWLGSNRGIIRLNRSALNAYLDGKQRPLAWQVFGVADGLSAISWTSGGQPRACKARDGKLWFATVRGAAVVDPNHLSFNPLPPPVVIEEIVIDDRSQAVHPASNASRLTVPPGARRLEFRFTGLSLAVPERVQFRFRLDPYDKDWVEAGTRRVAYYTGIPPGRFNFRVTACNNDGVWNETGASLGLVVLPPWWMTWWFRALTVIGIAGLVFGWYERRLHRLRREHLAQESFSRRLIASQENERQRLAGELHDGMGQDLLVIASQAQLSLSQEQNPPVTAARLKDIAETAKQALQQARRMAHNLRPGLLDELGLTKAVQATVQKAAQASGLSIAVSLADVDGLLSPEFEVNLFRITQETLNNVLRHAHASEAKIILTKESAGLRLVVEDNGSGFELSRQESAPPDQRGFGLRQIAERAKMMGGRVDIQSRPGQGTRLTVEVPIVRMKNAE